MARRRLKRKRRLPYLLITIMVYVYVSPVLEVRAQDPTRKLDLITPRTLFRGNSSRTLEKNAPPLRDRRFIAEPGFSALRRSTAIPNEESNEAGRDLESGTTKVLPVPDVTVASRPAEPPVKAVRPLPRVVTEPQELIFAKEPDIVPASIGAYLHRPMIDLSVERGPISRLAIPVSSIGTEELRLGAPIADAIDTLPMPEFNANPAESTGPIRQNADDGRFSIDQIIHNAMNVPLLKGRPAVRLSINDILARTLANSKNVQVLRIQPIEDRQVVEQEFGEFDWAAFFENRIGRSVLPVGQQNQFANANQSEIRSDDFEFRGGVRKTTTTGGQVEFSESIRFLDEDSGLLDPPDQAISELSIVFSQELLRDGGRDFVLSQALIASYQADQSHAASVAQISEQLQNVLNEYWTLFENRSNYFIQLALTRWAKETLEQLEQRRRIDAEENTVEQARALLLEAQADLVDAKVQVQISQDRLYRLVNDPSIDPDQVEMITSHPPAIGSLQFDPRTELATAMQNRGEIYERLSAIAEAAAEHHVSLNQLLPRLTVSIESSLNGLEGNREVFQAKTNAINTQPTVEANFNLEFFLGNRLARATNRQTQLRLRRLQFEYEDQVEQLRLDVAEALRTLNAASGNVGLRAETLVSRRRELEYLRLRRDVIPQDGANVSLLLEQFFQALNRLVASQQAFVAAKANIQRALADLQRAKGLLIHSSEIPQDEFVVVPRIPRALRQQLQQKPGYVRDINQRVVEPALSRGWPRAR